MRMKSHAGALVSLALALSMFTVACSTSWIQQALAIIAALTPAVTNIVPLIALADKNVGIQDIATIQKYSDLAGDELRELASLIDQYNQASGDQTALLAKINTGLTTVKSNLSQIFPLLHVADPKSQLAIQTAIGVAISEVASIEALLPLVKGGQSARAAQLARPLGADQFRSRYNAAISPVPGADKLKLRERSLVSHLKFW